VGLGFSVKVAPGVRIRASSRGVRTSLGPRAARIHVGSGRTAVSTGAGPVTFYSSLGGGRRRAGHETRRASPGASQRAAAQAAKAQEAQRLADALHDLLNLHRVEFPPASPPLAPPVQMPDAGEVHRRHEREALAGISVWQRAARAAARERAGAAAIAELAATARQAEQERQQLQHNLDELWRALSTNEPDVVLATLEEAFEDNEAAAAAVSVDGDEVSLVVLLPGMELIPERVPDTTPAGNLTLRKLRQGERDSLYTTVAMAHTLITLREAFAVAPGLNSARLVAVRAAGNDAYGQPRLDCLLAGRWTRSAFQGVRWHDVDAATIAQDTASELLLNLQAGKKMRPLDLRKEPAIASLLAEVDTAELAAEHVREADADASPQR
jgi:hypothetical protein